MTARKGDLGSSDLDGIKFAWSRGVCGGWNCWSGKHSLGAGSRIKIETSDRKALHPRGNTMDMQKHLVAMGNGKELSLDELGNVIQYLTYVSSQ